MTKVKVINKSGLPLPSYKTNGAACVDIAVSEDVILRRGETFAFHTGLFVEVPEGYCLLIVERSSLHKHGVCLANSVGVIDSDYRGEIRMILRDCMNDELYDHVFIPSGTRVAQAFLKKIDPIEWVECDSLDDTERGESGIGSTGCT